MIKFIYDDVGIIFEYSPVYGVDWIERKFDEDDNIVVSKAFYFSRKDLVEYEDEDGYEETVHFRFAELEGDYYRIDGSILGIDYNVYFYKDIKVERKFFVAHRNISIFRRVSNLVKKDVLIGGESGNFNIDVLKELVNQFPNSYEMDRYVEARIDRILSEYIEYEDSPRYAYDSYMNKKAIIRNKDTIELRIYSNELEKFEFLLSKLKRMLDDEVSYIEKDWQREILDVILLLYPKYLKVFEEVPFLDVYSGKTRRLDFLLVDASGFIDVIEIKKPNDISLLSKGLYRENYVPLRELSGTIMQLEKYIFYLNKWGIKGEKTLTNRFSSEIPDNISIRIVNPSGIIIMGRSNGLNKDELSDFEVIKRKYKNIVEIMTYDDLIFRLENIINKWKAST